MSKIVIVSTAAVALFLGAVIFAKATQPKEPTLGVQMADQIKKLKPIKVIVMPRAENKSPIAIGAWRYVLKLQQYNEKELIAFYEQHLGNAPEATLN